MFVFLTVETRQTCGDASHALFQVRVCVCVCAVSACRDIDDISVISWLYTHTHTHTETRPDLSWKSISNTMRRTQHKVRVTERSIETDVTCNAETLAYLQMDERSDSRQRLHPTLSTHLSLAVCCLHLFISCFDSFDVWQRGDFCSFLISQPLDQLAFACIFFPGTLN